ncbi:MAG: ubiquitin-like small modifier protein 1 [Thermoanaerobaculia bacterium]
MSLLFVLPGALQPLAGERAEIRLDGNAASVGAALDLLWSETPAVRDRVVDELGHVRAHVNVFVDGENVRDTGGLSTPVRDGAEILILAAVSGG